MLTFALATMAIPLLTAAGGQEQEMPIGKPAPVWQHLPGADGRTHSLDDFKGKQALVLVFYANQCPDCQTYLDRIIEIAKDYNDKSVATVLISVSTADGDALPQMTKLAKQKNLPCVYVQDRSQKLGRQHLAIATPQVFLYDKDRMLVYRGAIDDHWNPEKVKRRHLRSALDELLAGKKISLPTTEANGCTIEYDD